MGDQLSQNNIAIPNDQSKSRLFIIQEGTLCLSGTDDGAVEGQSTIAPGRIVDQKYRIAGLLGEGGMGAVYKAHHMTLNKDVALKTFKSNSLNSEEHLRFQREAKALARLNHSAIVQIFDFGFADNNQPYYTMEYLTGQTLSEKIKSSGPLPPAMALEIFIQICQGLAIAHSKSIIHRDLKPSNIFLQDIGPAAKFGIQAKVVDFGIASLTEGLGGQNLTVAGAVFGSPLYMSPEQSGGEEVTAASDIYSLGCALFEALTGEPPFHDKNMLQTIMQHQMVKAPSLEEKSGKRFSRTLEQTLATMLAKSPARRQQSMAQLLTDLQFLQEHPDSVEARAAVHTIAKDSEEADRFSTSADIKKPLIALSSVIALAAGIAFCLLYKAPQSIPPTEIKVEDIARQDKPAVISAETRPQGNQIVENGRRFFKISWPDHDICQFPFSDIQGMQTSEAKWKANSQINFRPSLEFAKDPQNFKAIPAHSITGIQLHAPMKHAAIVSVIELLGKSQPDLFYVDLIQKSVVASDLKALEVWPKLYGVYLSNTQIQGKTFGAWVRKLKLASVGFSEAIDASGLLETLRGDSDIHYLALTTQPLTESDIKIISTMPNLENLDLSATGLGDRDIKTLARLKNLRTLSLKQCGISEESLPLFAAMAHHKLKTLEITGANWRDEDRQKLRSFIHDCNFDGTTGDTGLDQSLPHIIDQ